MIENRMVLDSEYERETPWEAASDEDIADWLSIDEIAEATEEYLDGFDMAELYDLLPEWVQEKIIAEYIHRHEHTLSERYNESHSGSPY